MWTGTALTCTETNNEIIFLHSRFNNESTKFCSNRSIVGESIEVLNENIYISWLNVTLNPSLIGETVKCEKDNGTDTSLIANFTLPNDIGILKIQH